MGSLRHYLFIIFSLLSIVLTTLTFINFTSFLSDLSTANLNSSNHTTNDPDEINTWQIARATVIDLSLLSIFILQHSSVVPLQDMISASFQLPVLSRPLLNMLTSASLQLLMRCWHPIPQYALWIFDTEEHSRKLAFVAIHAISWLLIYVMMISMDITDLLGIKQVYYFVTGRPSPSSLKSQQLRSLHLKMRHPSFLCFCLIFWIHPYMRLDRLLLAGIWSFYMLLVWRPNSLNYNYIVQQQALKMASSGGRTL